MKKRGLKVLYVGFFKEGSTSLQRCLALRSLGHQVSQVDGFPAGVGVFGRVDDWLYRKGAPWTGHRAQAVNRGIVEAAGKGDWDVLWLDKGIYVTRRTVEAVKRLNPAVKVVGYSPDYMEARHNNSRHFVSHSPFYDLFITTKSSAVEWHRNSGCKKVLFLDNAYDPDTHRPMRLSRAERERWGGKVGFIGTYERDRARDVAFLAENGVPVRIYGSNWPDMAKMGVPSSGPVYGQDYARAVCAFDINLCFLRKLNRDLQTTRSVEITACGAFMLAERSDEHLALFQEGKEAEFFGDRRELLEKCVYYLAHPAQRLRIARAGRLRCLRSGYDNASRIKGALDLLSKAA